MKKFLLALVFCLASPAAWAQCTGVFPPNTLCGNLGASPAPPAAFSSPVPFSLLVGADPTGTVDSTNIFAAQITSGSTLIVPPGTYLICGLNLASISNFRMTAEGYGGVTLKGTSSCANDILTLTDGNFDIIEGFGFLPGASSTSESAITLQGTQSNTYIQDNLIQNFPTNGINLIGAFVNPQSGNRILRNTIINYSNRGLNCNYSNDYWMQNNSIGYTTGTTSPAMGAFLQGCSAGVFSNNSVFSNIIGTQITSSSVVRFTANRVTQSQKAGTQITSGSFNVQLIGNVFYDNSASSAGTFDGIQVVGGDNLDIVGNQNYYFVSQVKCALSIDNSSININTIGNYWAGYLTGDVCDSGGTNDFSWGDTTVTSASVASTKNNPPIIHSPGTAVTETGLQITNPNATSFAGTQMLFNVGPVPYIVGSILGQINNAGPGGILYLKTATSSGAFSPGLQIDTSQNVFFPGPHVQANTYTVSAANGVSCAAGSTSAGTLTTIGGIITHC